MRLGISCLDWIFEPPNQTEAAAILARNRDGMSEAAAARAVAQLVSDHEGLTPKAALDRAALRTVVELRNRFGEPPKHLTDPGRYIDLSYYEAAIASRRPTTPMSSRP